MQQSRNNLTFSFSIILIFGSFLIKADDLSTNDEVHASTIDIIRMRGYTASEHYITTPDGYVINLIRALNPLIHASQTNTTRRKDPLLCIHGITVSSKVFVVNSVNARPRNYARFNATKLGKRNLSILLKEDPASSSIVFSALNFGHEVWLINQRGTTQSQGHRDKDKQAFVGIQRGEFEESDYVNYATRLSEEFSGTEPGMKNEQVRSNSTDQTQLTRRHLNELFNLRGFARLNAKYWNFSMDEQVQYDLPMAMDFILEKTKKTKLAIVSHSQGGCLILMALALRPDLSEKISKNLLWAPALYPTGRSEVFYAYLLGSSLDSNIGATPSPTIVNLLQGTFARVCRSEFAQTTYCMQFLNAWFGFSGSQMLVRPGFLSAFADSASTFSMAQMTQAARKGKMHHFDYIIPARNRIAYGQSTPPLYNISKIDRGSMAIFAGNTDILAPWESILQMIKDLSGGVVLEINYLNKTGLYFNHCCFVIHRNVSRLLIQPSLRYLES